MGLESKTTARVGRKRYPGKLHLDSKALTFKGPEFTWTAKLGKSISATIAKDLLVVTSDGRKVSFEVGESASKWVNKILNPPDRLTKLGVKPDHKIWLSKGFDNSFISELKQHGTSRTRQVEKCDLAFWKVTDREYLVEFPELADRFPDGTNLWVVWTKGSKQIGQTDVMTVARELGFGPSKTAAFDAEHSSMRFARKKSG